jgi:hypothetical protein
MANGGMETSSSQQGSDFPHQGLMERDANGLIPVIVPRGDEKSEILLKQVIMEK